MNVARHCVRCPERVLMDGVDMCAKNARPCSRVRGCTQANKVFAMVFTRRGAERGYAGKKENSK